MPGSVQDGAVRNRIQFPVDIAAAQGPQALLERPQVTVGAVHSVKGREADVIILFPDLSQAGDAAHQCYGPPRDAVIRMFYVGMTRAREARGRLIRRAVTPGGGGRSGRPACP